MAASSAGGWVKPDGTVIPQDDMTTVVVGFYGSVMMQVQSFEFALAVLVAMVERKDDEDAPDLEEQMRISIERWERLSQKLTAGQAKHRLRGKVSDELIDYIGPLVDWRNFLAHRYLRVRMLSGKATQATPQMALELMDLALRYQAAVQRLVGEHQKLLEALPATDAPQTLRDAVGTVARQIASQDPSPLPPRRPPIAEG